MAGESPPVRLDVRKDLDIKVAILAPLPEVTAMLYTNLSPDALETGEVYQPGRIHLTFACGAHSLEEVRQAVLLRWPHVKIYRLDRAGTGIPREWS